MSKTAKSNSAGKHSFSGLAPDNKDSSIEETSDTSNNIIKLTKRPRPRLYSMCVDGPKLVLEESEEILKILSTKQRKMSDYSADEEGIGFTGRESIIEWCHSVVDSINLNKAEKLSIFHRFCTAYDLIMDKLFLINKSIKDEIELKIMTITIFLLSYKLEGFSVAKVTISSLVDAFLSDLGLNPDDLKEKVFKSEMKIIQLMDYNPQIFDDNNIHQLAFLFLDLFIKKYPDALEKNDREKLEEYFGIINQAVEFSENMLFKFLPLDKALITFYCCTEFLLGTKNDHIKNESKKKLKEFYEYLVNMKIARAKLEDFSKYVNKYENRLKKENKKD